MDYSYKETKSALNNRIDSHKQFSNFSLHEWISQNFNIISGQNILDLGCGNGNFTDLFKSKIGKEGRLFGVDKNEALVEQAKAKTFNSTNIEFYCSDFDEFRVPEKSFDWIFSIYSIYYTEDLPSLLLRLQEGLNPNGQLVIVGPGRENALALDEIHRTITNAEPTPDHRARISRIQDEVYPKCTELFGLDRTKIEIIDTEMNFQNAKNFADYYFSTLLWRTACEGASSNQVAQLMDIGRKVISSMDSFKLGKQMTIVTVSN